MGQIATWGETLKAGDLSKVETYSKESVTGLYPYLLNERRTIAYAWNYSGSARLYINGSVIARRAPKAQARIVSATGKPLPPKNGRVEAVTNELLDALTEAYREAAGKD